MKSKIVLCLSALIITTLMMGCRITGPVRDGSSGAYIYLIGEHTTPGKAYAVSLSIGKAYIADGAAGLRILDTGSPHFPTEYNKFEGDGIVWDVVLHGDYAYLAAGEEGLQVVDTDSPFGPELVGNIQTTSAFGLSVAGDYVYLADGMSGVRILDVSSPYSISELSRTDVSGQVAYSTTFSWPYLYVSSEHGFSILNVENLYSPFEVYYESIQEVYDIHVIGRYAYIACYNGLRIYDISNAYDPELLSELTLIAPARSVTVRGDFAYMALGAGGLSIIRIANPKQPYEVTYYSPSSSIMNQVVVSGIHLYIADSNRGLLIVEFWPGN